MQGLLKQIHACTYCAEHLPLEPKPIVQMSTAARILIIGQAPGLKAHDAGKPWQDASGNKLRTWLNIAPEIFYDESKVAIVPMGFCYPGKGKSGDLPPRPECVEQWHQKVLKKLNKVDLVLYIGQYAQNYYLNDQCKNLTERVKQWQNYTPNTLPLPHPSPRNQFWLKRNPWFETEVIPWLQRRVQALI